MSEWGGWVGQHGSEGMMDEDVMKRDALRGQLPLWLRPMWLPPPEDPACELSLPCTGSAAELWPQLMVNGTVHFRYLGPSNDELNLRLPLYGLGTRAWVRSWWTVTGSFQKNRWRAWSTRNMHAA